jgi:hypothetical protein
MTGFRTAKPVLRALLGLALLVPSVLGPLPAAAQSPPPMVTFTPGTVAPGGTVLVTIGGFACEQSVTIDLTSVNDSRQIITLGSVFACKNSAQFTLSTSVPVDQYWVRATDRNAVQVTAQSVRRSR